MISRTVSIAPMMGWTDRHARYFLRLITRRSLLYTEMVTTGALINGDHTHFLRFDAAEHPVALQLGGSEPAALAQCSTMAQDAGYDEVNLNVGCPSDRVKSGLFGACLMAQPERVADCIAAMQAQVAIPVTVKCRIGIDDMEGYDALTHFIETVAQTGCSTFIVHARKAWLDGLSPKQNRDVPPLKYDYVYRLKQDMPQLDIVINGGIKTLDECRRHLRSVDGVMLGREAYHNPYLLAGVDRQLYHDQHAPSLSREEIVENLCDYIDVQMDEGVSLHSVTRHVLGLYQGCPGARSWRRHLSENSHRQGADSSVLRQAAGLVSSTDSVMSCGGAS